MSTVWVMKFIPYSSPTPIDMGFKTEEKAVEHFEKVATSEAPVLISDDFGMMFKFDPTKGTVILISTRMSADFQAALNAANAVEGQRLNAQKINPNAPPPFVMPGRKIQ